MIVNSLVAAFVGRLAGYFVGRAGLSAVDRVLGLAFGLARGVSVVLIGFSAFYLFNIPEPSWMDGSQLAPLCRKGASYLIRWLLEWVRGSFGGAPVASQYSGTSDSLTSAGGPR